MPKRGQIVELEHLVQRVSLPRYLAEPLEMIIEEEGIGLTTESLRCNGVKSPKHVVYELRKLGAQIATYQRFYRKGTGKPPVITRYVYQGWNMCFEALDPIMRADEECQCNP